MGDTDRSYGNLNQSGWIRAAGFLLTSDGTEILPSAMEHQHAKTMSFTGVQTDATHVIHVIRGATGTVRSFCAGSIIANTGDAEVEIDLLKNGVSILSAAKITLDDSILAYISEVAVIDDATVIEDDVLTVDLTIDSGVYPAVVASGVFCELRVDEKYKT